MTAEEKKQYCLEMANTIFKSLFWSIDICTLASWGVSKRVATWFENKPSLELHVQGMLHKGVVLVSYENIIRKPTPLGVG